MCGIAVAVDWDRPEDAVRSLIGGILHRGDITDPLVSPRPGAAMCTRRLRIVDADHGQQPMLSANGRVIVAMNGEIYNHDELRQALTELGVRFQSLSDTEVLANALSMWGSAALPRLIGMYAFVALDLANGDFVAARDPLGVKPLYVIQSGEGFLFCSEIKPLLKTVEVGDVLLVPPGYLLTKQHCIPFETVFSNPTPVAEDSPARLDELLAKAVHIRVPPDLPFAVTFSGGIDSTLVAHYARQIRPEAPGYFLGDRAAPDYAYAARYADQTGLDLRMAPLPDQSEDAAALIDAVIETAESFEPGVVRGGFCNYVLARKIHQDGYRVVLCGEGADELFAGYAPHELAFAVEAQVGQNLRAQSLSQMNRDNLQRLDRCTMMFQVEAREPFLDPSIIRYALSCDAAALVETVDGQPRGKAPLRRLYDLYPNDLPAAIRDRSKIPFNEGAGFDVSQSESPWVTHAEQAISDAEFKDGQQRFSDYAISTKEELYYLRALAEKMDISRVPHLQGRTHLHMPPLEGVETLRPYMV